MVEKQDVEFRGVAFENGRSHLIVPEINVDQAEALSDRLDIIADASKGVKERQVSILEVVLAALQRNYPDMTMAELRKFATKNMLTPLFCAATGIDQTSPKVVDVPDRRPLSLEAPTEESGPMLTGDGSAAA